MNVSGILNGKIYKDKDKVNDKEKEKDIDIDVDKGKSKDKDKDKGKDKGSTVTLVSPIESEILSKYDKKVFKSNLNRRKVSEIDINKNDKKKRKLDKLVEIDQISTDSSKNTKIGRIED